MINKSLFVTICKKMYIKCIERSINEYYIRCVILQLSFLHTHTHVYEKVFFSNLCIPVRSSPGQRGTKEPD